MQQWGVVALETKLLCVPEPTPLLSDISRDIEEG